VDSKDESARQKPHGVADTRQSAGRSSARTAGRSQSQRDGAKDVVRPDHATADGPRADTKGTPRETGHESRMSQRASSSPPARSVRRASKPKAETSSDTRTGLKITPLDSQDQRVSPGRSHERNGTESHRAQRSSRTPEGEA
jgi:hypothetical protein